MVSSDACLKLADILFAERRIQPLPGGRSKSSKKKSIPRASAQVARSLITEELTGKRKRGSNTSVPKEPSLIPGPSSLSPSSSQGSVTLETGLGKQVF